MSKYQRGEMEILGFLILMIIFAGIVWFLTCIRVVTSEQNVSGIVYGTTNNAWPSGNTQFKVRASVDSYVNERNESSYCLPSNSPYISLVNKAASDKNVKVVVTTSKVFQIVGTPWTCVDNVKVELAGVQQ